MYQEKTIRTELIFTGNILSLRVDTIKLGEDKTATREIVEHGGAVCMVALNEKNQILLVRQFRKPIEKYLLEIPAGRLEKGEDPSIAAGRELREETGYRAEDLKFIGKFYTAPGFTDEIMFAYLAQNLSLDPLEPDEDEFVELIEIDRDKFEEMILSGEIEDGKTIAALSLAKQYISS